jgi:multidrug efflux pump
MNFSEPFIRRPVATTLLTAGIALAGAVAYRQLPVSPLPQIDLPIIQVSANMAGASPETMASSVATPLERRLGAIANVTEMTSQSGVGTTGIVLQFGLDRDIDGAARDVQAAINAARADLPTALRSNPGYHKFNPTDFPILILTLTSPTMTPGELYDAAATVLQQKLSQVPGVGDVTVGGSSLPAVRVEMNPSALFKYGIGLEDVRAALAAANANSPKGAIENDRYHWQVYSNDQARNADQYRPLIVAYRNGAPVRLSQVANVQDSVEDIRNLGYSNGQQAVVIYITRQPGANIIDTVDRVVALLPQLQSSIPSAAQLKVAVDRSTVIRASLRDVETSLVISIVLVIAVVFFFLRDIRATLIPSVAVPISLIGTFGAMYLLGYSLDNLSLMALTIATGFVVDDAIVVMENTVRHMEAGMPRFEAALIGVRQVGFTVLAMSLSLIAVFIPILFMGGIFGRLFREFAVTLSVSIVISMIVSLSTTPMMCSRILGKPRHKSGRLYRLSERFFEELISGYESALRWVLDHAPLTVVVLIATIFLNFWLWVAIPKGFFPDQDTGRLNGFIQADQSISFQLLSKKMKQFLDIVQKDPAVDTAVGTAGSTGGSRGNSARVMISLKPLSQRSASSTEVIARLRPQLARVPGATLFLNTQQEIGGGSGRQANATYQYTLQADELSDLRTWTPKLVDALKNEPILLDVNSDQQDRGLETDLVVDRDTASRLGLTASQVDNTLDDAFAQRSVSTIYESLNQYHVIMVVAPKYWQDPQALNDIYVSTSGGGVTGTQSTNAVAGTVAVAGSGSSPNASSVAADAARNASLNAIAATGKGSASTGQAVSTSKENMVPLSAFAHYQMGTTPVAVNHQGQFAAATISFNLAPGASLSDAVSVISREAALIGMPTTVHGSFQGNAGIFQKSLASEPVLILAAIVAIYIVLGVLYESYAHPFTILTTLPSAGLGAVLALNLFNTEFSLIALIGVFLLIGIVKKNAIMMIDFAIEAERTEGLSPRESIFKASLMRFRPIMMTTMAALLGSLPLAIGFGNGGELRRPLGISIAGGLIVSQLLTLFTTPVVYMYVDRAGRWLRRRRAASATALAALLAGGCAVGPNYHRPQTAVPADFKEAAGWKTAAPNDAAARGAWWEVYKDPILNDLESQATASNQTLKQAADNYESAREIARVDWAGLLPNISATGSATRVKSPNGRSSIVGGSVVGGASAPTNTFSATLVGSWTPDFWGRVRRQVQSDVAAAQASAADLANAKLSLQAELAQDYIELRILDRKRSLLDHSVEAYQRTLQISQNKYNVGVAARSDVISAEAQLDATRAQAVDTGVQRAQLEHAIAVLVGRAPADFTLDRRDQLGLPLPEIPRQMPSDLLERRPDIASAERAVAEENAKIGVQIAAYFPTIALSADGGFEGAILHSLFQTPNRMWSVGGNLSETLFDAGSRRAAVLEARADYEASVAGYRETVLTAFQQVEDDLAGLRLLGEEQGIQEAAVNEAAEAAQIAVNEYNAGTVDYTTVVTAEVSELTDRESDLTIIQEQLTTSVALIEALGGGWSSADLPERSAVLQRNPPAEASAKAGAAP